MRQQYLPIFLIDLLRCLTFSQLTNSAGYLPEKHLHKGIVSLTILLAILLVATGFLIATLISLQQPNWQCFYQSSCCKPPESERKFGGQNSQRICQEKKNFAFYANISDATCIRFKRFRFILIPALTQQDVRGSNSALTRFTLEFWLI